MIKIGEYVRTNKGKIDKVKEVCKHEAFKYKFYRFYKMPMLEDEEIETKIVKHSKNIIDLIEVGDYVNGEYVIQIDKESNCIYIENTYYDEDRGEEVHKYIKQDWIKSIVTKEQFENIEYRLEN